MLPPHSRHPPHSRDAQHPGRLHLEGFQPDISSEEVVARKQAEIEMNGEEVATGFQPALHPLLAPEVRFLHISRRIHQLITARNRLVDIFLGIASLLFAASTALLNARPEVMPMSPNMRLGREIPRRNF